MCRRNRSNFECGLLLVILVNFICLIIMISIYLLYGLMWFKSGNCERLCCKLRNYTTKHKETNPYQFLNITKSAVESIPETKVLRRHAVENNGCIWNKSNEFPYMGVLLKDVYYDVKDSEKFLKCAVIIISNSWALSSPECTKELWNVNGLFIRLNSSYWSKDGDMRKVNAIKVAITNAFGLIQFQKLKNCTLYPKFEIHPKVIDNYNISTYTFTWFSDSYKFERLAKVKVHLLNSNDCPDFQIDVIFNNNILCGVPEFEPEDDIMGPLVTSDAKFLIGIHFQTVFDYKKNRTFLFYLELIKYKTWISTFADY